LLSHYIDLLNSLATQQDLESFEATVHLYGYFSDDEMREVERQMKKDWDSLSLHQDELLHVGPLSNVLDMAWLLGCAALAFFKPLLLPILLPYMIFNVVHLRARSRKLIVARKYKECARELANTIRVQRGADETVAGQVNQVVEEFERTDGSGQEIYLKLSNKAREQELETVCDFYYSQFEDSKPRRGFLRNVFHFLALVLKDEEAARIRAPEREVRKAAFLRDSRQQRSLEFLVLPTKESFEIYLADEFSNGELFPFNVIPPALHPTAHLVSETDVEINNVVRVPEALDPEKIRSKLSQSLFITTYSRSKFQAMKLGHLISFEKRQIPIGIMVVGGLDMAFGLMKGAFFISPILVFGVATFGVSLLLSRKVKKHFSDIARGFDKIFGDFSRPTLVTDEKLAELNGLVKDSANLVDAYTETFHRALHFGWDGIADVYQSKAVFHQREFKEPGECIMRLER
ncbi:MAG: hypothetical protein C4520_06790, partial [Candidatus Abyssobacteria bacterium SURF_5]